MKIKRYPARNCYRLIVPRRYSESGKIERKYFKTRELAQFEIDRILRKGRFDPRIELSPDDAATIQLVRSELGGSLDGLLDIVRHHRLTVLNVQHQAHLFELVTKFIERQEREGRAPRTLDDDRQRLNKFCHALTNIDVTQLTEQSLRAYIDQYPPGGNRKSHHKTVRKFIRWAHQKGYLALDLMSRIPSMDKWGMNKEIVDIEDFRRLLFVTAGLEPIKEGQEPTTKYLALMPYYVLGGLAGMRRAEILRDRISQQILEWPDINWAKNLIKVRDEVAKQTRAADRTRYIPLEPAAKEWLQMVAKSSGPVVDIYQSTHTRLNKELLEKLEIDIPENGLRNSYASYAQSFRSLGDVAKAAGDLESTIKRFYVQTLEPESGRAWFDIRPGLENKIVPMAATA